MPSISPQNPNPIDRNADNPARQRRNWQRASQGALTNTIKTSAPISTGSTIGLALISNGGLAVAGGALGISTALSTTAPLTGGGNLSTGLVLAIPQATSTVNGYLSSTDWTTFNSKQGALGNAGSLTVLAGPSTGAAAPATFIKLSSTYLPADVAYVDVANVFTAQQTIKAILGTDSGNGTFEITSNVGILRFGGAATINQTLSGDLQVWAAGSGFPAVYISGGPTSIIFRAGTGLVTVLTIGTGGNPTFSAFSNTTVALTVSGAALQSSDLQQWTDSTPTVRGRIDFKGRYVGAGSTPGTAAGTGAGTGPTLSLTGHDVAGQISLTTGTGPAASATILTATFSAAFAATPTVLLSPANAAAAALSGTSAIFVTATGGTFVLNSNTAALAATTLYLWNYHVIG